MASAATVQVSDIALSLTALLIQSVPFLLAGVLFSSAIEKVLPKGLLPRTIRKMGFAKYPISALAGAAFPVCECAALPVAVMLYRGGLPLPCAVIFLLASPAINPVAMVSTWAAFQGQQPATILLLRFTSGIVVAMTAGGLTALLHRDFVLRPVKYTASDFQEPPATWLEAAGSATRDFLMLLPYLVLGSILVAIATSLVPRDLMTHYFTGPHQVIPIMQVAAFSLSLCSSSDAFIVAPLAVSAQGKLAFLILGPVLDIKLLTIYATFFSKRFLAVLVLALFLLTGILAALSGIFFD